MGVQQVWQLSSTLILWISVTFLPSVCLEMDNIELYLESKVFVALAGKGLTIGCFLKLPVNQTSDTLTCSNPLNEVMYSHRIHVTAGQPQPQRLKLELKNLTMSGEYSCQYKTAEVFWFLQVRKVGYKEIVMWDYTEVIIVSIFTGVLLVFSVAGSVYVFRKHWKERVTERSDAKRKKQNKEERREREKGEDKTEAIASASTSFYASLEPRPRSIYDVLDHSAAITEPDQSKAKPKKKEPPKMMAQTKQPENENVFESVYENF